MRFIRHAVGKQVYKNKEEDTRISIRKKLYDTYFILCDKSVDSLLSTFFVSLGSCFAIPIVDSYIFYGGVRPLAI